MAKNRKRKISWKKIVCGILAIIVIISCIGGISSCFKKDTTKAVGALSFSRGGLDENGNYVDTKASIFTEDMFECLGLVVTPDIKFNGTYQLFYYNYDGVFLEASQVYTKTSRLTIPELAKYARIMITVDGDEDIGYFEMLEYAALVEIEVQKKQNFVLYNYFKIDEANPDKIYSYSSSDYKVILGSYLHWYDEDNESNVLATGYSPVYPINVKGWKNVVLVFDDAKDSENIPYFFTDADGKIVPPNTILRRFVGGSCEYIVEVPNGATTFYTNTLTDKDGHYVINRYN